MKDELDVEMFITTPNAQSAETRARKEVVRALQALLAEYDKSNAAGHARVFGNAHWGFAVLNEELDELWDEVRGKTLGDQTERRRKLKKEAIQVGAMALKFLLSVQAWEEAESQKGARL